MMFLIDSEEGNGNENILLEAEFYKLLVPYVFY